ncbi:hypothetical protein AB3N00_24190 [Paenibacillus xylanilyticus]
MTSAMSAITYGIEKQGAYVAIYDLTYFNVEYILEDITLLAPNLQTGTKKQQLCMQFKFGQMKEFTILIGKLGIRI